MLVFGACTGATVDESATFEPGDARDAVLQAALVASTTKTVQITVTNGTSRALAEGAIVLTPPLVFNETSMTAFFQHMKNSLDMRGTARLAGLTVNRDLFIVPAVPAGGSATVMISAAAGVQLLYVAKVAGSVTDFVASEELITWPNGSKGNDQTGFTIDANGEIQRGNNSVGTSPKIAVIAFDVLASCGSSGNMARPLTLMSDNFATVANSSAWPMNSGYDLDFNGDWLTDGITARVWNPASGNPEAPRPVTTGFVKFLDVCPTANSTISITASVDAAFTNITSSATLVLYFFNASGTLLRVDANHKIGRGNVRKTSMIDSAVPITARRIAIVPMAYLAPDETGNIYFSKLDASYAPQSTYQVTAIASDTLAVTSGTARQPTGWAEFGGDYFVMPSPASSVTLWNSTWGGDQSKLPPIDTGLTRRFTVSSFQAGDVMDARVFAAATFTDASSFVRIRMLFKNSSGATISSVDSDRLSQRSYGSLDLLNQPIPTGTTAVDVVLNAYLGAQETSSFYAQNLSVNAKRLLLK